MKYFTRDLLERYGSEDERIADAAHEEFETLADKYQRRLAEIRDRLPPKFVEMQDRFYFHDAKVAHGMTPWLFGDWQYHPEFLPSPMVLRVLGDDTCASLSLLVHLDTPPQEFLVLHYRGARIETTTQAWSPRSEGGYVTEWLYDEVEEASEGAAFLHSILFTRGLELQIRFTDFDFATLSPPETTARKVRTPRGR